MTLATRFVIDHPAPAREVFDFAREMIGATDAHTFRHETQPERWARDPRYQMDLGQGLPALMRVEYGADGPLHRYEEDDAPDAVLEIVLDTAYGYRDDQGRRCHQLHADYVAELGRWCERRGWDYAWQDEFSGDWFTDWRQAAEELGV